ncbi:ead/Ea22-like family protein, partial [Enterobacter cloacae]|uniref:ead/Ea22-like family protein n=1 Tax=Enterobacter cloacae TaxID=550 RepID=UPI00255160B1
YNDATFIATADPATVLALLDEMEAKDKQIVELQALACGVKQYSEFQICHYGATEDYAKGYIDCQNNYNKVLFAAAGKGE